MRQPEAAGLSCWQFQSQAHARRASSWRPTRTGTDACLASECSFKNLVGFALLSATLESRSNLFKTMSWRSNSFGTMSSLFLTFSLEACTHGERALNERCRLTFQGNHPRPHFVLDTAIITACYARCFGRSHASHVVAHGRLSRLWKKGAPLHSRLLRTSPPPSSHGPARVEQIVRIHEALRVVRLTLAPPRGSNVSKLANRNSVFVKYSRCYELPLIGFLKLREEQAAVQ